MEGCDAGVTNMRPAGFITWALPSNRNVPMCNLYWGQRKETYGLTPLHISSELLLIPSGLLSCISLQPSHYSIYKKDRGDKHTINLASDKCFGMVGTCQERMEEKFTADRRGETCRYTILTISGSSFNGLIVINISRRMKDCTLVVAYGQLPIPYIKVRTKGSVPLFESS